MFEIGRVEIEYMIAAGYVLPTTQEIDTTKQKLIGLGANEREVLTFLCLLAHAPEAGGALAVPIVIPAQHDPHGLETVARVVKWLPIDQAFPLYFGEGPYMQHMRSELARKLVPIRAREAAVDAAKLAREREAREQAERDRVNRWRMLSPAARADKRLDRSYTPSEFAAALDAETRADSVPPSNWTAQ
jgi:hypothetical protein